MPLLLFSIVLLMKKLTLPLYNYRILQLHFLRLFSYLYYVTDISIDTLLYIQIMKRDSQNHYDCGIFNLGIYKNDENIPSFFNLLV